MQHDQSLLKVMPIRVQQIEEALAGYHETGVPLVALDGAGLSPAGFLNDVGMTYFVTKISTVFGLSPATATDVFFLGMFLPALLIAGVSYWLLFTHPIARVTALAGLATTAVVAFATSELYMVAPAAALAVIPPFLYLHRRGAGRRWMSIFLLYAGLLVGLAHMTRSHAGTAVALFIVVATILSGRAPLARRGLLLLPLAAGMMVAPLSFHYIVERRDDYLLAHVPNYQPVSPQHVFWHSVYIGFGYLSNPSIPKYLDEVAIEHVQSVAPEVEFGSRQYERVLRSEVVGFVLEHPFFAASTVFAKLGVIALYLLVFANVGLWAALRHPNPPPVEAAFRGALAFSALFGILVVPWATYLTGFITFAVMYMTVGVNTLLTSVRSPVVVTASAGAGWSGSRA